ncbi:MAG: MobF family relaxase [Bacteroidota bacterium]
MLRINVLSSAEAASSYYQDGLSRDDYYAQKENRTYAKNKSYARWYGKAAEMLDLGSEVTQEDFLSLCHNLHPQTEKRITARNAANRRPGYDFTFNAPKSLSILFAFTEDMRLLKAHQQAVLRAMQAVEAHVQTQKGQGKQKSYIPTGNITYAAFDHFKSRPIKLEGDERINEYVPDPHLHTHCVVMNHTYANNTCSNNPFSKDDGRFQALELGTIKKEAPYYEALYHSYLSSALEEIGLSVERTASRWEIKGFERETIDKFSNRTLEIMKSARAKGLSFAEDIADEGRKTRNKKQQSVTENEILTNWEARLTRSEKRLITSLQKGEKIKEASLDEPISPEKCINLSLQHFLERKSVISEKRMLAYAMSQSYGNHSPEIIQAAYNSYEGILKAPQKDGSTLITTSEVIRSERNMLRLATASRGMHQPLNPDYEIQQSFLNEGQRAAIQHVLGSSDGVCLIAGDAGTGKTTLMKEVQTGIQEAGKQLFAFAPSAEASRGVLQAEGFEGADTIARLLTDTKLQERIKNQVILIDEAGMVGTQTMENILSLAHDKQARVILSGDWKQHKSVEAGDALKWLELDAKMPIARVQEIVRQQDHRFKEVVQELASGKPVKAFSKLQAMGSIREMEDSERNAELAKVYVARKETGRSVLIVSPTHLEGRKLTHEIRALLKEKGRLGDEKAVSTLRLLSYTEAQKQDHTQFETGQFVQFHRHAPGIEAGKPYKIRRKGRKVHLITDKGKVPLPLEHHTRFQVFQKGDTLLAKGDLIRITQNGRDLKGRNLSNGQVYEVNKLDHEGNIHLKGGKVLDKGFAHFRLGYYQTSHSAQGKTADTVLIAQSSASFPATSPDQLYVSVSRGKKEVQIFTDDTEGLLQQVQNSSERLSASGLADQIDYRRQKVYQHEKENSRERKADNQLTRKELTRRGSTSEGELSF